MKKIFFLFFSACLSFSSQAVAQSRNRADTLGAIKPQVRVHKPTHKPWDSLPRQVRASARTLTVEEFYNVSGATVWAWNSVTRGNALLIKLGSTDSVTTVGGHMYLSRCKNRLTVVKEFIPSQPQPPTPQPPTPQPPTPQPPTPQPPTPQQIYNVTYVVNLNINFVPKKDEVMYSIRPTLGGGVALGCAAACVESTLALGGQVRTSRAWVGASVLATSNRAGWLYGAGFTFGKPGSSWSGLVGATAGQHRELGHDVTKSRFVVGVVWSPFK